MGIATEYEVLPCVDPLFLRWFKERRSPTAENTGSFKEIDPVPECKGSFSGGNSCQSSADNAYFYLRFTQIYE